MRACIVCLVVAVGVAHADPSADAWQALTRNDIEAAYALVNDNHPATLPEAHDTAFVATLRAAHDKAIAHAAAVSSFEGYRAVLAEFALSLGDGHLWSRPLIEPREVRWAGILAGRRGTTWVVAANEPALTGEDLTGARILTCDNQPIDSVARDALAYRAQPGVEASAILRAGWLLIDDGNPFIHRPRECRFQHKGRDIRLALHWTAIDLSQLRTKYWKLPVGRAGFDAHPADRGGYWVAIEELNAQAQQVIDSVKAAVSTVRAARYVVVDLRGNGGGNDLYGRLLANLIYGDTHVAAVLGPMPDDAATCKSAWRASPGNLAYLEGRLAESKQLHEAAAIGYLSTAVDELKAALAAGRHLTAPLTCPAAHKSAPAPSLIRAPVFVLTDSACFSSCIGTLDMFRKLGAIQIGHASSADTHNSEVREIKLPSGLSMFSTLQAIMPDAPYRIGPFAPAHVFAGDITDIAVIQRWLADSVLPAHGIR
jgi:hypothetical protein